MKISSWLTRFALRHPFIRYHVAFDIPLEIGSQTLKIPTMWGVGLSNFHSTEPQIEWLLEQLLQRFSGSFVDVGANIGQTLLKVLRADKNRRYIGFEVHPFCSHYLDHLIKINQLQNCVIFPVGLASKAGVLPLLSSSPSDASATTVEGFRPTKFYSHRSHAITVRGDDIFAWMAEPAVSVIKIDVEGGEIDVIEGFEKTILKFRPCLIVEVLPSAHVLEDISIDEDERLAISENRGQRVARLLAFVGRARYTIFRVLPSKTLVNFKSFELDGKFDLDLCNYLLVPTEQLSRVEEMISKSNDG